jgi:hypothetical protein
MMNVARVMTSHLPSLFKSVGHLVIGIVLPVTYFDRLVLSIATVAMFAFQNLTIIVLGWGTASGAEIIDIFLDFYFLSHR